MSKSELSGLWEKELKNRGYKDQLDKRIKAEFEIVQTDIRLHLKEVLDNFELFFNNFDQ